MTDELIAYLLDDLCPERRAQVEQRLESDTAWQREYDRLRECLLAAGETSDGDSASCESVNGERRPCVDEPPQDLVTRTCCFVNRVEQRSTAASASAAGFTAAPTSAGAFGNWSFADVAVGGGVLLLLGMLMAPALRESRDTTRLMVCQSNLNKLGFALYQYQDNHGKWLPPVLPGHSAGEFSAALADYVGIDRNEIAQLIVCPESELADQIARGERVIIISPQRELGRMSVEERKRAIRDMAGSYAYRAGYLDDRGMYRSVKYSGRADEPMMADVPTLSAAGVRSGNHVGGQNVLDEGLGVNFRKNCDLARNVDNIYLNLNGDHALGLSSTDVVLMRPEYGPEGPVVLIGNFGR